MAWRRSMYNKHLFEVFNSIWVSFVNHAFKVRIHFRMLVFLSFIFLKLKEELGNGANSWVTRDEHMECKRYINFSPIRTPFIFIFLRLCKLTCLYYCY
jgi:predicted PurR-regulated permease PerM